METIDYAEMLEIPVSTVNVVKKRKRHAVDELKAEAIDAVNKAEQQKEPKNKKSKSELVLVGEFVACCLLCTLIFLTNIFYEGSAMNTFSQGIFSAPQRDKRTYSDFTLTSVVSERADAVLSVSSTGILSFTAKATIYPVCDGTISRVVKSGEASSVEISHSDSFKSVISGLRDVYRTEGEFVKGNLPVGYADGEVRVMLYEDGTLLTCYTVDENTLKWS